jgi:2-haloacid dehalogenase
MREYPGVALGLQGMAAPTAVAFDVVETLFSLEPLRPRLKDAGLPDSALGEWFARFLRDAFALEVAGVYEPFRDVAAATLEVMLDEHGRSATAEMIDAVLKGFSELPPHADVAPAFEQLKDAGVRVATLTNGSATVTHRLLERAALDRFVERTIAIDEVRHWKPHRDVYVYAARVLGVPGERLALVAAHAWDVMGAGRAGLLTGWVTRREARFTGAMPPPTVVGRTLPDVVAGLLKLAG